MPNTPNTLNTPKYSWQITWGNPTFDLQSDVGRFGPRQAAEAPPTGEPFRLYDDDGNLYYKGHIAGDYAGFEPLDDFGMPNAGCAYIQYRNPSTKEWETL